MWRPLFLKCIILGHKLQRMLNDSKIGQLNSERPLHQTAVGWYLTLIALVTLGTLVKLFSYHFFPRVCLLETKNIQQAVFVASFFLIHLSCISLQDLDLFKVKLWLKVIFKGNFSCLRSAMTWKYFTAHFSASLQYRKLLAWLFIKPSARGDEAMEV